jgi:hypothetical protein
MARLIDRVRECTARMRCETGAEPFLVYLGSAQRSKAVAEIFRDKGLRANVSPQQCFIVVEAARHDSAVLRPCNVCPRCLALAGH